MQIREFTIGDMPDRKGQHDDHIWLTLQGENWAIAAICWPFIALWRGYDPDIEYHMVMMVDFDAEAYADAALKLLYG